MPAQEDGAPLRRPGTDIGRVVLWMGGALVSFCVMAVSIRGLADRLNVFEILSLRTGGGIIILLALALARADLRRRMTTRHLRLHGLRNIVHFAAQVAWAQGILLLPLATVFALEFTTPLWVALLATIVLGERMTLQRAATVILGFAGVLVILRPGMQSFQPAALLVLGAAVGFAVVMLTTKRLTATDSTYTILLLMNLMQFPLNLLGSDPGFLGRLDGGHLLPALGVAVAGLTAHFCVTTAFRSGDALVVVPLDFLRIPLIAVIGWLFYREALDPLVFAGSALIIAGIVWNLWAESKRQAT